MSWAFCAFDMLQTAKESGSEHLTNGAVKQTEKQAATYDGDWLRGDSL